MSYYNGPRALTDGLVMYFDAGNQKSYPSSGTSWYDLSGTGNTGTLTNGPTFTNTSGGGVVFDGVNDYVNIPNASSLNPTSAVTLCSVFRINGMGSNYAPIIFKQNTRTSFYEQYQLGANSTTVFANMSNSAGTQKGAGANYSFGTTMHATAVFNVVGGQILFYVNGVLTQTTSITISFDVSTEPVRIGGATKDYIGYASGSIYTAQIYNKALSGTEVLQNYHAVKGRFGI